MRWYAVSGGHSFTWWVADDASTDSEARVSCNMMREQAEQIALKHNTDPDVAKLEAYEKWFTDHAAVLATHRIGGFDFAGGVPVVNAS